MSFTWSSEHIPHKTTELTLSFVSILFFILVALYSYTTFILTTASYVLFSVSAIVIIFQVIRIVNLNHSMRVSIDDEFIEIDSIQPLKYGILKTKVRETYDNFIRADIQSTKVFGRNTAFLMLDSKNSRTIYLGYGCTPDELKDMARELVRHIKPSRRLQQYVGIFSEGEKKLTDVLIDKTKEFATRKAKEFIGKRMGKD